MSLEKIASNESLSNDDIINAAVEYAELEKQAADADAYGRSVARAYFAELVKQAEAMEKTEEEKKAEEKKKADEEKKKADEEKKAEEKKEEEKTASDKELAAALDIIRKHLKA